jgi:hypothetical protein
MDNGSANATMIEVARLLAQAKDRLYRGVRIAFWSGHSHGRYSGSTWYVDHHWEELYDHCVAHVNIDSTGARGATFYGSFPAHLELAGLGERVIEEHTGQTAHAHRMSRAGDMSFNGVGLPSLFMSLSQAPYSEQDTDYVSLAFGKLIGGKMPWWWHTSEDTLDKVDLDVLELDTRIYLSVLWQLCTQPVLPLDFRRPVADLQATLGELGAAAGEALDFTVAQARADQLAAAVEALAQRCATATPAEAPALNAALMRLSRLLIPLTYTQAGPFEHDPAWGMPHLPGLASARRLAALDAESDEYHFVRTQTVRALNHVNFVLRQALEAASVRATSAI